MLGGSPAQHTNAPGVEQPTRAGAFDFPKNQKGERLSETQLKQKVDRTAKQYQARGMSAGEAHHHAVRDVYSFMDVDRPPPPPPGRGPPTPTTGGGPSRDNKDEI